MQTLFQAQEPLVAPLVPLRCRSQSLAERIAFWRAFITWTTMAENSEFHQLELALLNQDTDSCSALVRSIQAALREPSRARLLPPSLVQCLCVADGPRTNAAPLSLAH